MPYSVRNIVSLKHDHIGSHKASVLSIVSVMNRQQHRREIGTFQRFLLVNSGCSLFFSGAN